MSLLVQVAQLKRGAAQATERVRRSEANLRNVKTVADEDKETLRCVAGSCRTRREAPCAQARTCGQGHGDSMDTLRT